MEPYRSSNLSISTGPLPLRQIDSAHQHPSTSTHSLLRLTSVHPLSVHWTGTSVHVQVRSYSSQSQITWMSIKRVMLRCQLHRQFVATQILFLVTTAIDVMGNSSTHQIIVNKKVVTIPYITQFLTQQLLCKWCISNFMPSCTFTLEVDDK